MISCCYSPSSHLEALCAVFVPTVPCTLGNLESITGCAGVHKSNVILSKGLGQAWVSGSSGEGGCLGTLATGTKEGFIWDSVGCEADWKNRSY